MRSAKRIGGKSNVPFMNKDFLLKSDTAKALYHEHAEQVPIIDYFRFDEILK